VELGRLGHSKDIAKLVGEAIPQEHVEFLRSFHDTCRFGDYLIVHAGIRPGVELQEQRQADLRSIREPFLFDDTDHGFVVVHGHTISTDVEERANRIGIDTGAYRTGVLTALAIEGNRRWYVTTRAEQPAAAAVHA
jgi:serine/threonine protein phosphatase 1